MKLIQSANVILDEKSQSDKQKMYESADATALQLDFAVKNELVTEITKKHGADLAKADFMEHAGKAFTQISGYNIAMTGHPVLKKLNEVLWKMYQIQ